HIHEEKDGDEVWCYEQDPLINYSLARFFLCFAIPMMIMVVAYGLSALQIRQHMNILQTKHRERLNSNIGSMNGENNRLSITATTTQGSINNLHRQIPQNKTKGSYNNLQLGAGQAHEIGEPVQYIAGDKPQIVIHSPQGEKRLIALSETGDESANEKLKEVYVEMEAIGAASAESRARRILSGLGFTTEMQQRPVNHFSGGWRMRVSLARYAKAFLLQRELCVFCSLSAQFKKMYKQKLKEQEKAFHKQEKQLKDMKASGQSKKQAEEKTKAQQGRKNKKGGKKGADAEE
ncbi:predicted protein, partial [Nematostella vectensis]